MRRSPKFYIFQAFKISISVTLVAFLIYQIKWQDFTNKLGQFNFFVLGFVFVLRMVQFPISTLKWSKCLKIHDLIYSFNFLHKVVCIGFFFNNFLPTTIGGDGYRLMKTVPESGYKSRAVSALLLERLIGFLVLIALGIACAIVFHHNNPLPLFQIMNTAGVFAFILCILLPVFFRLLGKHLDGIKAFFLKIPKIEILKVNFLFIRSNPRLIGSVVWISIIFHLIAISSVFLLFKSINVSSTFYNCAIAVSMTGLISLLPISINGIGLMEGSFVLVCHQIGIPVQDATITIFIYRLMSIVYSIFCGGVYIADQIHQSRHNPTLPKRRQTE